MVENVVLYGAVALVDFKDVATHRILVLQRYLLVSQLAPPISSTTGYIMKIYLYNLLAN